MSSDGRIFEAYKPLRNHLSKVGVEDSFYALWAYIQHLQFGNAMPPDFEVDPQFLQAPNLLGKHVYPWELETLTQEVIINAQSANSRKQTFKRWSYFSSAVNKLKTLENEIGGTYINTETVLAELHRIAHRQFPWQEKPSQSSLIKYFKVFNDEKVDAIVRDAIDLSVYEVYIIGILFTGAYIKRPAINLPIELNFKDINPQKIERFLKHFSVGLVELKRRVHEEQEINDKFVYAYSSLRAFPIIRMQYQSEERLVCPLPTLLFWRITSGLYYEICDKPGFSDAFGRAFQNYVGKVLEASNTGQSVVILPEEKYKIGKDEKDTVDWLVSDSDAALFIECKAKRMKLSAKAEFHDQVPLNEELDKMAEFIVQTYKSIHDYISGHYPSVPYNDQIKVFPVVVTLENWFIFGDKLLGEINLRVIQKLTEAGLPESYITSMPYSVCSVTELEEIAQVIQSVGIKNFMDAKNKVSVKLWAFSNFIRDRYPEESKRIKSLFKKEFDQIVEPYQQHTYDK